MSPMSSWGDILMEQLGGDILIDQQQARAGALTIQRRAGRMCWGKKQPSRSRTTSAVQRLAMPDIPDLTDPRYLEEIGWFLYYEKYRRDQFGGSYEAERLAYSRLLLAEVAEHLGRDVSWVEGKTVVSLGCGCTGDLAAFPAAVKIAIDPLLY